MRLSRALVLGVATLAVAAGPPGPARADHTGTLPLNDRVGPYVVMAWTEPREPRTDACRVTATVLRPATYRPVLDAAVRIEARRADGGGTAVAVTASRGGDPPGLSHTADLRLPTAGRWTVTVEVSGPDGTGRADFPIDVLSKSWRVWPAAVAGWLWRQGARRRPRRSAA